MNSITITAAIAIRCIVIIRRTLVITLHRSLFDRPTAHSCHLPCQRILLGLRDLIFRILLVLVQRRHIVDLELIIRTAVEFHDVIFGSISHEDAPARL